MNNNTFKRRFINAIKVFIGKADVIHLNNNINNYVCSVCKRKSVDFKPLPMSFFKDMQDNQFSHSPFLFETFNFSKYSCSYCGSSDRERLYALYIDKYLIKNKTNYRILDFMPSGSFKAYMKNHHSIKYITTDLLSNEVDINTDIHKMNEFKCEEFDFFICSHILEHVTDDLTAIKELYRITKKGGSGIIMVPIALKLDNIIENIDTANDNERWKYYGQGDHVRLYNKNGFINRITSFGFDVIEYTIKDFGESVFNIYGIYPTSTLYIVSK